MKRALAIINPKSGTSNKGQIPALLAQAFAETDTTLFITYTKAPEHAYELAKQAASEGYERVIAVGGDGTINEVARGLINSQTALAIIPMGSGNGLARALGLPLTPSKAVEVASSDVIDIIDCCTANGRPFFCTCGMGFDAEVSKAFAEAPFRGFLSYAMTAIEHYVRYKPEVYSIDIDGQEVMHSEAFVVAAANASQYGNNAYIAPRASMVDGLVDIVLLKPFRVYELAKISLQLFSKNLEKNIHQHSFQTRRAVLHRPSAGVAHLDGEPLEMPEEITIEVLPKAIRVVRPDHCPEL